MSRPALRRRLPLLGVVAVLALVGILTAGRTGRSGEAVRGASISATGTHSDAEADHGDPSFRGGETPAVVRLAANRLHPVGHALPLVSLTVAALVALVAARPLPAAAVPRRLRAPAARYARRRGPPALLIV